MSGWGGVVNIQSYHWQSNTRDMPITGDAFQSTTSGSDFYFMVLTDDGTEFLYGTYLGGTQSATHVDGGTSRFDKGGVVYHAVCAGCAAYNPRGTPPLIFRHPGARGHGQTEAATVTTQPLNLTYPRLKQDCNPTRSGLICLA